MFSGGSEMDGRKLRFLSPPIGDSPACLSCSCPPGFLSSGLNSEAAAQSKSWSSVSNLSLLLEIQGLTFGLSVCRRPAHAMSYRTTSCVIWFQPALLQFAFKQLAYTWTDSFGSCWYSCMAFVAELRRLSLPWYIFWSSFVKSSKFSKHGSLAARRSLAHPDWAFLSVCHWVRSGWLSQLSRKVTASLTWSGSPLGNRCLWEAKYDRNVSRNLSSSFALPHYRKGSAVLKILDWLLGFSGLSLVRQRSSVVSIRVLYCFHLACCSNRSFSSIRFCSSISFWSSSVIFDKMSSLPRLSSPSGKVEWSSS